MSRWAPAARRRSGSDASRPRTPRSRPRLRLQVPPSRMPSSCRRCTRRSRGTDADLHAEHGPCRTASSTRRSRARCTWMPRGRRSEKTLRGPSPAPRPARRLWSARRRDHAHPPRARPLRVRAGRLQQDRPRAPSRVRRAPLLRARVAEIPPIGRTARTRWGHEKDRPQAMTTAPVACSRGSGST